MRAPADYNDFLDAFYINVNPMTVGAYFLGIVMVLSRYSFTNSVLIVIIDFAYSSILIISLVALMGMTSVKDILYLAPHIIIIAAYFYIAYYKSNLSVEKCNKIQIEDVDPKEDATISKQ